MPGLCCYPLEGEDNKTLWVCLGLGLGLGQENVSGCRGCVVTRLTERTTKPNGSVSGSGSESGSVRKERNHLQYSLWRTVDDDNDYDTRLLMIMIHVC